MSLFIVLNGSKISTVTFNVEAMKFSISGKQDEPPVIINLLKIIQTIL